MSSGNATTVSTGVATGTAWGSQSVRQIRTRRRPSQQPLNEHRPLRMLGPVARCKLGVRQWLYHGQCMDYAMKRLLLAGVMGAALAAPHHIGNLHKPLHATDPEEPPAVQHARNA